LSYLAVIILFLFILLGWPQLNIELIILHIK
jgi:hypothetical protein